MPKPWQDALLGRQHDRSPSNVGCKGDGMAEALGRPRRSGEKSFEVFSARFGTLRGKSGQKSVSLGTDRIRPVSELSDMLGRQMAEALAVGSAKETAWLKP